MTDEAGTGPARKQEILDAWYREQIRQAVPDLLAKWEPLIGEKAGRLFLQQMKTRWGGCNPTTRNIRLNTELAKKPPECLEYIVVHELLHMLERKHNDRFVALMSEHLPQWRYYQDLLSRLPMKDEVWDY